MISIEDFLKLELKVGTVLEVENVEESEKLIKLKVDIGDPAGAGPRQILAGVKQWYSPEDFVGKQIVVISNLESKKMMGHESQGMMLAADTKDGPVFLTVSRPSPNGAKIR